MRILALYPPPPFPVLRALPALALALALTFPGVALADSHVDSNDAEETTPNETGTSDKTDDASDLPEVDGWVELGVGSFSLEVEEATVGTIRANGTGALLEAGLRQIGDTGAWISLSRLSVDYDNIEIAGRTYAIDGSGTATLLSAGWEWVTGAEKRSRPYVGVFLGTDSNAGLQGGIRYRFANNVELGGKIIIGREDTNVAGFGDAAWAALGATVGYVF